MKRSDSGDFCVLYVEPDDEKSTLFQKVMEQKKPIVIMLAEQTRVFQRPEDFTELKHIRRHLDVPVLFVSPVVSAWFILQAVMDSLFIFRWMRW